MRRRSEEVKKKKMCKTRNEIEAMRSWITADVADGWNPSASTSERPVEASEVS